MILLFTSDHCTWCDVIRKMLEEEAEELGTLPDIFEVNVDRYQNIAEVYNILVVPTLVSGMQQITGVPTQSDLRSFILQISTGKHAETSSRNPKSLLCFVRKIQTTQSEKQSVIRTA